jgi:nitroreductase
MNDTFFKLIFSRHSMGPKHQTIPAPDVGALRLAVSASCHVPCHGPVLPFRWVEVADRGRLANLFEQALPPDADDAARAKARSKAAKSPLCMALIETGRSADLSERAEAERLITVGAALMNFLAALHAQGFVAKTVSAKDFASPDGLYDPANEKLLAFVLAGTPDTPIDYSDIGMGNDEALPLTRW